MVRSLLGSPPGEKPYRKRDLNRDGKKPDDGNGTTNEQVVAEQVAGGGYSIELSGAPHPARLQCKPRRSFLITGRPVWRSEG
jgi:hypothetical protein